MAICVMLSGQARQWAAVQLGSFPRVISLHITEFAAAKQRRLLFYRSLQVVDAVHRSLFLSKARIVLGIWSAWLCAKSGVGAFAKIHVNSDRTELIGSALGRLTVI